MSIIWWREVLHAADSCGAAGDVGAGAQRRAVLLRVLHRQAAALTTGGAGEEVGDQAVLHACRTTRLPEPAFPDRVLFPSVHATGGIGRKPMTGDAVNEMIRRRAATAGFTPAKTRLLGPFAAVGVRHQSLPARTRTPSCGRPGIGPR